MGTGQFCKSRIHSPAFFSEESRNSELKAKEPDRNFLWCLNSNWPVWSNMRLSLHNSTALPNGSYESLFRLFLFEAEACPAQNKGHLQWPNQWTSGFEASLQGCIGHVWACLSWDMSPAWRHPLKGNPPHSLGCPSVGFTWSHWNYIFHSCFVDSVKMVTSMLFFQPRQEQPAPTRTNLDPRPEKMNPPLGLANWQAGHGQSVSPRLKA